MQLTEITYTEAMPIEGYGPGFFRIGGQVLQGACLITPWGAGAWGGGEDHAPLLALVGKIDVLFYRHRGRDCPCPQSLACRS